MGRPHRQEGLREKARDKLDEIDYKTASFISGISGIEVARIIESGKLRATETAEIIGNSLGKGTEKGEHLSPLDNPGEWVGGLNETSEDTMLVGHLPHLGKLASLLLAGAPEMKLVEFSPGGVLCLERNDDGWTVQWMVVPQLF